MIAETLPITRRAQGRSMGGLATVAGARLCVLPCRRLLLAEETEDLQVTRGHILILGWRNFETPTVWVSLYNSMAYEVTLTKSYRGVWQPLQFGQVFDREHHKIVPLTHISWIVLPPGFARRAATAYQTLVRRPPL